MKILTKEEEQAHYNATLKGGIAGGIGGTAFGLAGVYGAAVRYPAFRSLTLPMRAFLVTSAGTFAAIIAADRASRKFETARHPEYEYKDEASRLRLEAESHKSNYEKAMDWGKQNRYSIVGGSWVASMAIALGIVGRSPYLTTAQKIVQARVYAQGLTVAVLIATAAFELGDRNKEQGRWESVKVLDPNDPTHKHLIERKVHHETYAGEDQWKDMMEAEERRMKEREAHVHELEGRGSKVNKGKGKKHKDEEEQPDDKRGKTEGASRPSTSQ